MTAAGPNAAGHVVGAAVSRLAPLRPADRGRPPSERHRQRQHDAGVGTSLRAAALHGADYWTVIALMTTGVTGASWWLPCCRVSTPAIASTTSMPSVTRPKTA